MPKRSAKTAKAQKAEREEAKASANKKKKCNACETEKPIKDFQRSNNTLHTADGLMPICKECFIEECVDDVTGEVREDDLRRMMRMLDKPFYYNILQSSVNEFMKSNPSVRETNVKKHGREILKFYMKNIHSLPQLSGKTYQNSEDDGFWQKSSKTPTLDPEDAPSVVYGKNVIDKDKKLRINTGGFDVTDDMVAMFGDGYSKREYKLMWDKWELLSKSAPMPTKMHEEQLITYIRAKVKEEIATAAGDVDSAKKWLDIALAAAAQGKFTPKQLSQTDLQGGVSSFSELFKAIEQAVDIVPILPTFKQRPNDSCDFLIQCQINCARDMLGMEPCSYQDIYTFYDRMKQDYIEQHGDPFGIFAEDVTESLRDAIKSFITLPDEYYNAGEKRKKVTSDGGGDE